MGVRAGNPTAVNSFLRFSINPQRSGEIQTAFIHTIKVCVIQTQSYEALALSTELRGRMRQ